MVRHHGSLAKRTESRLNYRERPHDDRCDAATNAGNPTHHMVLGVSASRVGRSGYGSTPIVSNVWCFRTLNTFTMAWGHAPMAVRVTRSAGLLLLAIWLILTGLSGFAPLPMPGVLMAALALIAGILILLGM
jgi:hypothetical protein